MATLTCNADRVQGGTAEPLIDVQFLAESWIGRSRHMSLPYVAQL